MRRPLGVLCIFLALLCIAWWIATAPERHEHIDTRSSGGGSAVVHMGSVETVVDGGLARTEVRLTLPAGNGSIYWVLPPEAHVTSFVMDNGRVYRGEVLSKPDVKVQAEWLHRWRIDGTNVIISFESGTDANFSFSYLHPVPFMDEQRRLTFGHPISEAERWDLEVSVHREEGIRSPSAAGGLVLHDVSGQGFKARGRAVDLQSAALTWKEPVPVFHVEPRCEEGQRDTGVLLVSPVRDEPWPRHVSLIVDPRIVDRTDAVAAATAMVRGLESTATWDIVAATDPPVRSEPFELEGHAGPDIDLDAARVAAADKARQALGGKQALWDVVWLVDGHNATGRPDFDVAGAHVHVVAYGGHPGASAARVEVVPPGGATTSLRDLGAPLVRDFAIHVEGLGDQPHDGTAALLREGQTRIAGFAGAWLEDMQVTVTGELHDGLHTDRFTFRPEACRPAEGSAALAAREGSPTVDEAELHRLITPWSAWYLTVAGTHPPVVLVPEPFPTSLAFVEPWWVDLRALALPLAFLFSVLAFALLAPRRRFDEKRD